MAYDIPLELSVLKLHHSIQSSEQMEGLGGGSPRRDLGAMTLFLCLLSVSVSSHLSRVIVLHLLLHKELQVSITRAFKDL